MTTFLEYQTKAGTFAKVPNTFPFQRLFYSATKLAGETGEVLEKIGKQIRSAHSEAELYEGLDLISENVALELGDVLWYLSDLAGFFGYDLEDIANKNLAKLSDREARGVIVGSGDNR